VFFSCCGWDGEGGIKEKHNISKLGLTLFIVGMQGRESNMKNMKIIK